MPPAFCEGNQRGAAFRDKLPKKSLLRLREPRYVNNNQEAYTCKRARDSVQPELRPFHIGRGTARRSETHSCLLFASCSHGFPLRRVKCSTSTGVGEQSTRVCRTFMLPIETKPTAVLRSTARRRKAFCACPSSVNCLSQVYVHVRGPPELCRGKAALWKQRTLH